MRFLAYHFIICHDPGHDVLHVVSLAIHHAANGPRGGDSLDPSLEELCHAYRGQLQDKTSRRRLTVAVLNLFCAGDLFHEVFGNCRFRYLNSRATNKTVHGVEEHSNEVRRRGGDAKPNHMERAIDPAQA